MSPSLPPQMLSADDVKRVSTSFALVAPAAPMAARLFYANLFEAHPSLRPLFRGDMEHQGRRLMEMIGAAVGLLERPQALVPVLRQLGARHAGYGVLPWHYGAVGEALLRTLSESLGPDFGHAERQAWSRLFVFVAHEMQHAGETVAA